MPWLVKDIKYDRFSFSHFWMEREEEKEKAPKQTNKAAIDSGFQNGKEYKIEKKEYK